MSNHDDRDKVPPPALGVSASRDGTDPVVPSLRDALTTQGTPIERITVLSAWWSYTRITRTLARYGARNGGLLSSGMALTSLLSLTAALTVGWTVLMWVLGDDPRMLTEVVDSVNKVLPGLLTTSSSPGLVDPSALVASNAWSLTSIVAFVVMAWSAISLIGSMGTSIRSVFGIVAIPENMVARTARNAVGAVGVSLALVIGAGSSIALDLFGGWAFGLLGVGEGIGQVTLVVASRILSMAVNAVVALLLVRVVASVRVPWRDLGWGLAMLALAFEILRQLGTTAVGSVTGPLLTTATTLVTLVLWINLQVRVMLTVCAWMANPPAPVSTTDARQVHYRDRPNFVTMSDPTTLAWPHHPITGEIIPVPLSTSTPTRPTSDPTRGPVDGGTASGSTQSA